MRRLEMPKGLYRHAGLETALGARGASELQV